MASMEDLLHLYEEHKLAAQAVFSAAVLLIWYVSLKAYLRNTGRPVTAKPRAWILSLLASFISTPIGVVYGLELLQPGWKSARLLEADEFSDFMTVFFVVYFIIDTILGIIDYGSEFGILTGCTL